MPKHFVYVVPDSLDICTAAKIPVATYTADNPWFKIGQVQAAETVPVHAATSEVGLTAAVGVILISATSRVESYGLL